MIDAVSPVSGGASRALKAAEAAASEPSPPTAAELERIRQDKVAQEQAVANATLNDLSKIMLSLHLLRQFNMLTEMYTKQMAKSKELTSQMKEANEDDE